MRTKTSASSQRGPRKGPICFGSIKPVTADKQPKSEGNDTQGPDDPSCEEGLDINSDERDLENQLEDYTDEDTEADFWKRLLLLEAGWYDTRGRYSFPNITEEIDKALQKMQLEGSPSNTIMGKIRTKFGWTTEDGSFLAAANQTLFLDPLSNYLYSGLGLDKLDSSLREMAMRAVRI